MRRFLPGCCVLAMLVLACTDGSDQADEGGTDATDPGGTELATEDVTDTMPAECQALPRCTESPTGDVCPDPRCCEQLEDGTWRVSTYAIQCLDAMPDGDEDVPLADAEPEVADPGTPDAPAIDESPEEIVPTCDWATQKPTAWGPTGAVSAFACPAEAADVHLKCLDYTGDGQGDSGIRSQCTQLATLGIVDPGTNLPGLVLELAGVPDVLQAASFTANVLPAASTQDPPSATGDFRVAEAGYVTATCQPRYAFPGARIAGGALQAGPAELPVTMPIQETSLDLTLERAQVKGIIAAGGGADGFDLADGVFGAIVTKASLDAGLGKLQAVCDAAPEGQAPDWCQYLPVVATAANSMMDLHVAGDGTVSAKAPPEKPGNAISICFLFSLSKAKVVGFQEAVR